MSMRYKGATLSATAPVTTGGEDGTAPGAWTLEQQAQAQAAGLWPLGPQPNYIEQVFSTYLYTGTGSGSAQTINNGINLSGKGGLVWIKDRTVGYSHSLFDTARGVTLRLLTNGTGEQILYPTSLTAFNSNGFTIGDFSNVNSDGSKLVSWTFRKQPKFFDVVTYTGNGVAGRQIAHSLGSAPGCIIVKQTSGTEPWAVYHRSLGNNALIYLNYADGQFTPNTTWNTTSPTSTDFTVGSAGVVNTNGATYVAYIFAHDAGGFGLAGTDNVVSCGSYTTDASGNASVNLGYEPQWVMDKPTDVAGFNWVMQDVMRGESTNSGKFLFANLSSAESSPTYGYNVPTATGFDVQNHNSSTTYIYIAIRRGPMKVPTDATKVFLPVTYTGDSSAGAGQLITSGFPVDMSINRYNRTSTGDWDAVDRLRGITGSNYTTPGSPYLNTYNANPEAIGGYVFAATNTTVKNYGFGPSTTQLNYLFQRAPSFMDVVCYKGTGANRTVAHNLAAAPEMMIVKNRSNEEVWAVYNVAMGNQGYLKLNSNDAAQTTALVWNSTTPTSTVFYTNGDTAVNGSGANYVAYLFATCPGVSKVGGYTGAGLGTSQIINCGFVAGARFILIKRVNGGVGDWYVWDSARGIVASSDPYLLLNTTATENPITDYVDTSPTGFEISSTATAALNNLGQSYIFLAVA